MWTPQISFTADETASAPRNPSTLFRGYGLGWSLSDYRGRFVAGHPGAADGMFSQVILVPEENLGAVILTNSDTGLPNALAYRIIDAYLGADDRDWSREALERAQATSRRRADERQQIERARIVGTTPSLPLEAYTGKYPSELYGDATVVLENGGWCCA